VTIQQLEQQIEAAKKDLAKSEGTMEQIESEWLANHGTKDHKEIQQIADKMDSQLKTMTEEQERLIVQASDILSKA
jgi:flagellar biosynthesis chaperone FliJ